MKTISQAVADLMAHPDVSNKASKGKGKKDKATKVKEGKGDKGKTYKLPKSVKPFDSKVLAHIRKQKYATQNNEKAPLIERSGLAVYNLNTRRIEKKGATLQDIRVCMFMIVMAYEDAEQVRITSYGHASWYNLMHMVAKLQVIRAKYLMGGGEPFVEWLWAKSKEDDDLKELINSMPRFPKLKKLDVVSSLFSKKDLKL